jgi:hypothetical protein
MFGLQSAPSRVPSRMAKSAARALGFDDLTDARDCLNQARLMVIAVDRLHSGL